MTGTWNKSGSLTADVCCCPFPCVPRTPSGNPVRVPYVHLKRRGGGAPYRSRRDWTFRFSKGFVSRIFLNLPDRLRAQYLSLTPVRTPPQNKQGCEGRGIHRLRAPFVFVAYDAPFAPSFNLGFASVTSRCPPLRLCSPFQWTSCSSSAMSPPPHVR